MARRRPRGPTRAELTRCLAEVLGTDRLGLLLAHERTLEPAERGAFRGMCERLLEGEPLAYVLGHQEFRGRRFAVDPAVLIPRPETEELVEHAIAMLPESARVFEPCTGSGCISVSLALERPDLWILASDISGEALEVARKNAKALAPDAKLEIAEGDYWAAAGGRVFDALVANPPYVDPSKPELLDQLVERYEPAVALFDPEARSHVELLRGGVDGLESGALVLLECGADTAGLVLAKVEKSASYVDGELIEDLQGIKRILRCRRR
ncbi:MAG: peptide chain release factor N(5)-glutamine methyltransferase [Planctomycetota bacterium]